MSFVWFMQYGSNVGRDLYVVVGDVRKACLHTVVVSMVIPCSFSIRHLVVFPITIQRKVRSLFVLKYQVMGDDP